VPQASDAVRRYHDGSKHHFDRFARSLGYLDWASQPRPFRRFAGAPAYALHPRPDAPGRAREVGDVLRHSLGLSAWKRFREARWSLRVNPSSGNLHPTEAYVVSSLGATTGVFHYAAEQHELELRCEFDAGAWQAVTDHRDALLIVLTSIHWREAWKYGERAFRYCQHDLGHAIGAVSYAARIAAYNATLVPSWSHSRIGALAGLDRDGDFVDAEREEPGCLLALTRGPVPAAILEADHRLSEAIVAGRWHGRASQLSDDHVQWTFIDEVAGATRDPGRAAFARRASAPEQSALSKDLVLRRRSAVAFDGQSVTTRETFLRLLAAAMPSDGPPFDALWWTPRIHLVLFVHRVTDVEPGLYLLIRDQADFERLREAAGREFMWERADAGLPLYVLARGDCRRLACRLSCDQDIAADGFFSLGMIARFEGSLDEFGPAFYRHLFWECGAVGQALYLAAEAVGARATGIGCFYDDSVHEVLGLGGHAFQSLYHFTVGVPVEDSRLTSEPGYPWERA
jgi:SagB-type dehydrogenase family enzyme